MAACAINVVSSVNGRYVMPLTVMVRSLLENLPADYTVDLYVLEDGTTAQSRRRAEDSWRPYPIRVEWVTPDKAHLEGRLQNRGYAGVAATYFRLLMGSLLPADVSRVIYLDVDLIVRADLSELWNSNLDGAIALGVPDAYAGLFHLHRLSQVPFDEDVRFDRRSGYFNAGVMLVDLKRWRDERIGERAVAFALKYREQLTFHDQDALNCVLQHRWRALGPAWNFHELGDCLFGWSGCNYSAAELHRALRHPAVVHFIGAAKPWSVKSTSVFASLFWDYFRHTQWAEVSALPTPVQQLVRRILIQPHLRLNWTLWRGISPEGEPRRAVLIARTVAAHPWMLVTYPLWQLLAWLRFFFLPVDRRRLLSYVR